MLVRQKSGLGRRRLSGAAAVELAFTLPIFCTLIFAQIESARLGMVTQLLMAAARNGARVAILELKTQSDVQAAIDQTLAGTGISAGTIAPSPSDWSTAANGTPITVTLSVPYSQVSWLPTPQFLGGVTLTGSATLNSERP